MHREVGMNKKYRDMEQVIRSRDGRCYKHEYEELEGLVARITW